MGVVYGATLAVTHLVWDDPDVYWGRIGVRAGLAIVFLPFLFAVPPRWWIGRPSAPRKTWTPAARLAIVLLLVAVVSLVALRSYDRMAT